MGEYIQRRQNTVGQYIATQSLLELCEATQSRPRAHVGMRQWEQADIDLEGAMETAVVDADSDKDGIDQ